MPISKNDLRLGNHIEQGTIIELFAEAAKIKSYSGIERNVLYSHMTPIPLTSGYLIDVGFERHTTGWRLQGLFLLGDRTEFYMRVGLENIGNGPITTVHRVENLYHALTCQILPSNMD
jgi:hypothetical protein